MGHECGRRVREGLSHEGWGGFQEDKTGEGVGIPGRGKRMCSSILKIWGLAQEMDSFHLPGLLHIAVAAPLHTGPVAGCQGRLQGLRWLSGGLQEQPRADVARR